MCYKTVRITKRYVLQNGSCYKTVSVKKCYVTKWYKLQIGTFLTLHYGCTNPWISWAFVLT
jgi:hypothetical protein